jgi:TRAP-type C4-dicarboxylate transport system permease small subunit
MKKPLLLFVMIAFVAAIVVVASGIHVMPLNSVHVLPPNVAEGSVLYVCPTDGVLNVFFSDLAKELRQFQNVLFMVFWFFFLVTLLILGWALYNNLLKDKFEEKDYKFGWFMTKWLIWITLIVSVFVNSPNAYRLVKVGKSDTPYVLCESNNPRSLMVRASSVSAGGSKSALVKMLEPVTNKLPLP